MDLLKPSPPDISAQQRDHLRRLMVEQISVGHMFLDVAETTKKEAAKERCILLAERVRDRISMWLWEHGPEDVALAEALHTLDCRVQVVRVLRERPQGSE
jgi:hypothetical protein